MVASWIGNATNGLVSRWNGTYQIARPEQQAGNVFTPTRDRYAFLRSYYDSTCYDALNGGWAALKGMQGLPRTIRAVLPLLPPLVKWYRNNLFPGVFTADGLPDSNGQPNRVPYDPDATLPEIRLAAQQLLAWGNFSTELDNIGTNGPLLGDCFFEMEVDYDRQKVYPVVHHPGMIADVAQNRSGDTVMYFLKVRRRDHAGNRDYDFGKRVTKYTVEYFYDDKPMGYETVVGRDGIADLVPRSGAPAEFENEFGFCFGHWWPHVNDGSLHGVSVADGLLRAMDELNGMQSGVDDYIRRFIEQTIIVTSKDPAGLKKLLDETTPSTAATTQTGFNQQRQGVRIVPAPEGAAAFPVMQNLGLGEATAHFDRVMKALERNMPEVLLSEELRDMQQVTRPGALPLIRDAQQSLNSAVSNHYAAIVKMIQMGIAMGGHLATSGQWGLRSQLSNQQQLFLPFDLASYDKNQLAVSLTAPLLMPPSLMDKITEGMALEKLQTPTAMRHAGIPDSEIFGRNADGTANLPKGIAKGETLGLLAEKSENRVSAAGAFGGLFDSGGAD